MQSTLRLEDAPYQAGATKQVRMQTLPIQKRINRISLYFDLSGTKATADVLSADLYPLCVQLLSLQSEIGIIWNLDGFSTWRLNQAERGRQVYAASVPNPIASGPTTFVMQFVLDLNFRDESQLGSSDGALPTELFRSKFLEITFASATVWGVGSITLTAGNVRVFVEMIEESGIPQLAMVKYVDAAAGLALLERGIIKTAILVNQTGAGGAYTWTQAQLTTLGLNIDGKMAHGFNTLHEQLVQLWNQDKCDQGGTPHEIVVNAANFIPLVWCCRRNQALTKQPAVEKAGEARVITGSFTTPRLAIRYVPLKTDAQTAQLAALTNAPTDGDAYEPNTATKTSPKAQHASQDRGSPTKKARLTWGGLAGKVRRPGQHTPGKVRVK